MQCFKCFISAYFYFPSCKTQHPFPLFVCFFFTHFDSLQLRATFFSVFLGGSVAVFQVFHLGLLSSSIKRNTFSFVFFIHFGSVRLRNFPLTRRPFLISLFNRPISQGTSLCPTSLSWTLPAIFMSPLTSFFPGVFYLFPVPLSSPPQTFPPLPAAPNLVPRSRSNRVLQITDGVGEMGGMVWPLFGALVFSWLCTYFAIWKGVKVTGKIMYFTGTSRAGVPPCRRSVRPSSTANHFLPVCNTWHM